MILYLEIIIGLALIAYPIIKTILKGTAEFSWVTGFACGAHWDSAYIGVRKKEGMLMYRIHTICFYIAFISLTMAFSVPAKDDIDFEEE